ncbi:MAG: response regulator transcription factor [Bacteroidota bacterium]|nr:response regulator transcription factor [Bacteroidota bacterium]
MDIILTDDSIEFRKTAKEFLEEELSVNIINEASDGSELLNLKNIYEADILLLDLQMPKLGGIHAAQKIIWENPTVKIIAITMYSEQAYLKELILAGFKGCIFKSDFFEKIETALETVYKGKLYFPKHINLK